MFNRSYDNICYEALGEKEDMDTTVEGFQSWMTRGLSFLLPFLFFGYVTTTIILVYSNVLKTKVNVCFLSKKSSGNCITRINCTH